MTNSGFPFDLPPLPYACTALEPHFDARTMHIHHDEQHCVYVERLNAAVEDHPKLHAMTVEQLLRSPDHIPEAVRPAVHSNGGGHLNHSLFWSVIALPGQPRARGAAAAGVESKLRFRRGIPR